MGAPVLHRHAHTGHKQERRAEKQWGQGIPRSLSPPFVTRQVSPRGGRRGVSGSFLASATGFSVWFPDSQCPAPGGVGRMGFGSHRTEGSTASTSSRPQFGTERHRRASSGGDGGKQRGHGRKRRATYNACSCCSQHRATAPSGARVPRRLAPRSRRCAVGVLLFLRASGHVCHGVLAAEVVQRAHGLSHVPTGRVPVRKRRVQAPNRK